MVLAQAAFVIYVNDMTKGTNSCINLFTDNAKLLKEVQPHKNFGELQNYINKILYEWSKTWAIKLNIICTK